MTGWRVPLRPARPYARAPALAILLTALALATGCRTTATGATEPGWECLAFRPIRWSRADTDATRRQVIEHNAVWDALCLKE